MSESIQRGPDAMGITAEIASSAAMGGFGSADGKAKADGRPPEVEERRCHGAHRAHRIEGGGSGKGRPVLRNGVRLPVKFRDVSGVVAELVPVGRYKTP